jgi:hypothetical protein
MLPSTLVVQYDDPLHNATTLETIALALSSIRRLVRLSVCIWQATGTLTNSTYHTGLTSAGHQYESQLSISEFIKGSLQYSQIQSFAASMSFCIPQSTILESRKPRRPHVKMLQPRMTADSISPIQCPHDRLKFHFEACPVDHDQPKSPAQKPMSRTLPNALSASQLRITCSLGFI